MSVKYFTPEGLEKLKAELHQMRTKGRADIARQIAEAREKGDLSENAEYDAAKDAQGMLEMRIAQMESELGQARLLDESKIDNSKIMILSKVKLLNMNNDKEVTYTLVTESEANLREGKISIGTPIAKGLLGKTVGEIAEITVPSGKIKLKVLDIQRAVS